MLTDSKDAVTLLEQMNVHFQFGTVDWKLTTTKFIMELLWKDAVFR